MILDWPPELPRPERSSWQLRPIEARRKRSAEAGPPSYRRRFSAVPRLVTMSLVLSRSLKAVFDQFYAMDCAEGSHLFRMPDPTTDGWPLLTSAGEPVLDGEGLPVLMARTWLCAWGDDLPTETMFGQVEFRVTFGIVVLP